MFLGAILNSTFTGTAPDSWFFYSKMIGYGTGFTVGLLTVGGRQLYQRLKNNSVEISLIKPRFNSDLKKALWLGAGSAAATLWLSGLGNPVIPPGFGDIAIGFTHGFTWGVGAFSG